MCRSARSELVAPKLTSDSIGSVPMRFLNACRRGKLLVGGSTASVHPRAGEKSAYEDGPVGAEQADGIGVMAKVLPVLGSGRKRCVERWLMVDGERLWLVSGSQQCQSENRWSAAQFRIDLPGPMALSVGSRRESERASERGNIRTVRGWGTQRRIAPRLGRLGRRCRGRCWQGATPRPAARRVGGRNRMG